MSNEKNTLVVESGKGDMDGIEAAAAKARAGAMDLAVQEPKRGRGRPAGSGNKAAVSRVSDGPKPELFQADVCGVLVSLPFDVARAVTKSDAWLLDEGETKALSTPGAVALNEFCPEASPKWAALMAFSIAFLTISCRKYIQYKGSIASEVPA